MFEQIILKAKIGDDTRRYTLRSNSRQKKAELCSFAQLCSVIVEMFDSSHRIPSIAVLKYLDPENEWITIGNDRDLNEAIRCALRDANGTPILRINVSSNKNSAVQPVKLFQVAASAKKEERIVTLKKKAIPKSPLKVSWRRDEPLVNIEKPKEIGFENPFKDPMPNKFTRSNEMSKKRYLARFVADVTVRDDTVMPGGKKFQKIWRMRNECSSPWPEGTRLTFVGGDNIAEGECTSVEVPSLAPGQETDISVNMIAPLKPGRYVSYWRLVDPNNQRFGQRVWVDILVPPTAEDAKEVKVRDSREMQALLEMGFWNKALNEKFLLQYNNDLAKVLENLLK